MEANLSTQTEKRKAPSAQASTSHKRKASSKIEENTEKDMNSPSPALGTEEIESLLSKSERYRSLVFLSNLDEGELQELLDSMPTRVVRNFKKNCELTLTIVPNLL